MNHAVADNSAESRQTVTNNGFKAKISENRS
jgi:hypothetical protein